LNYYKKTLNYVDFIVLLSIIIALLFLNKFYMDIPITVHNDKKEEDQNENNHSEENPTEGGDGDKHEDHNNNEDNHGHDDNHDNNEPEEKQLGKTGIIAIVVIIILAVVFLIIRSQNAKDLVSGVGDSVRDAVGQEEEKMSESAMLMLDATPGTDTKVIAIQNDWIVNIAGIEFKNSGPLTDVAGSTATGIAGSD
jgi:flagellar biosynthesis/type III secretory pathway M-ring protein FliF/YscJ